MLRAVVTGGSGFLGSHLVDRLLAEDFEVVALDNLITGAARNLKHLERDPRLKYIQADVTNPFDVDLPVDMVFHFASPASPVDFAAHPVEILKVGSYGTHNALDLAHRKGARFIIASTSEVYGDPLVHPQTEDYWGNVNPIGVRSVYDEAKRYGEACVMAYRRSRAVNTGIVRIFNTYGPRMRLNDGRVVPNFVSQALRGEPLTVYGDGTQTRSFCYVSDLIEGIFRLATSDLPGPINIGNPIERTIIDFAREIIRATGASSPVIFKDLPSDDPKQRKPDITRARTLLGWEPTVELQDGILKTVEYFRSVLE